SLIITVTVWLRIIHYNSSSSSDNYTQFTGIVIAIQLALLIILGLFRKMYDPLKSEFHFFTLVISLISLVAPIIEIFILDAFYIDQTNLFNVYYPSLMVVIIIYLILCYMLLKYVYTWNVLQDFIGKLNQEVRIKSVTT